METILEKYGSYVLLEICVPDSLRELYEKYAETWNTLLLDTTIDESLYVNDGFDLYVPHDIQCEQFVKIDFGVKIQTTRVTETRRYPCGTKLYARSSITKTPLRLTNSVGVIDPGYRGNIMGVFDVLAPTSIEKHSRLVQLCADAPFFVKIIEKDDLTLTDRGERGFGSSGI